MLDRRPIQGKICIAERLITWISKRGISAVLVQWPKEFNFIILEKLRPDFEMCNECMALNERGEYNASSSNTA
jgi:hypothetical protein